MKKILSLLFLVLIQINPLLSEEYPFSLLQKASPFSDNWIFSPFSLSSCLSLVAEGANGDTWEELCQTLSLPEDVARTFQEKRSILEHAKSEEADFQLHLAQGIWIKEGFELQADYTTLLKDAYEAQVESVPFDASTIQGINRWVADQTAQKIQDLISQADISSDTRLVLANALYFQGNWKYPFAQERTEYRPFYVNVQEVLSVPTLHQAQRLNYFENADWQVVALPFEKKSPGSCEPLCLLFLPKHSSLQVVDEALYQEALSSFTTQKVDLLVPKFTLEHKIDVKPLLEQLGVHKVFSSEADLSKMSLKGNLYVDAICQKSFFSFTEAGVEAAAATAAIVNLTTSHQPQEQQIAFHADHPFFFALIDQTTQTLLFVGHVQKP